MRQNQLIQENETLKEQVQQQAISQDYSRGGGGMISSRRHEWNTGTVNIRNSTD